MKANFNREEENKTTELFKEKLTANSFTGVLESTISLFLQRREKKKKKKKNI